MLFRSDVVGPRGSRVTDLGLAFDVEVRRREIVRVREREPAKRDASASRRLHPRRP